MENTEMTMSSFFSVYGIQLQEILKDAGERKKIKEWGTDIF